MLEERLTKLEQRLAKLTGIPAIAKIIAEHETATKEVAEQSAAEAADKAKADHEQAVEANRQAAASTQQKLAEPRPEPEPLPHPYPPEPLANHADAE